VTDQAGQQPSGAEQQQAKLRQGEWGLIEQF
jgi:hypothetical protein